MAAGETWEIVISKTDEPSKLSRILQKGLELLKWDLRASSAVQLSVVALDAKSPLLWSVAASPGRLLLCSCLLSLQGLR